MSVTLSRRRFLCTAGCGALTALAPLGPLASCSASTAGPVTAQGRTDQRRPADPDDRALHAARRLTYGPTPALMAHIQEVGVDAFLEEQLHPEELDDSLVEDLLADFQTLHLSNAEILANYRKKGGVVVGELSMATLLRAVHSQRQLFEVMVDFWTNHFNIYIGDGMVRHLKTVDDREVIRAHALGRFADLLLASAKSPAMLFYLDNYLSRGTDPNENYARELLELHTVGVDGGYQESDIRPAALSLTGWTFARRTGTFQFRPRQHYTGPLQVMGWETPGHRGREAIRDGESLLDYLAHHPSTARFLARKLCVRFVSDQPPEDLVASAAQVYLDNDTAIVPVLRHIFQSDAFWASAGQKFRRPFELLAGALRVLNIQIGAGNRTRAARFLRLQLEQMGQPLFGWHAPNGYPDVAGAWLSTGGLLARWNLMQALVAARRDGSGVDLEALLPDAFANAGELVDGLAQRLLFQPLDPDDRAVLLAYLELAEDEPVPRRVLGYKLPQLVALLLNSVYFQYR